jgi:hypothetical protein
VVLVGGETAGHRNIRQGSWSISWKVSQSGLLPNLQQYQTGWAFRLPHLQGSAQICVFGAEG